MLAFWLLTAMTAQLAEVQAELETALRAKYPNVERFELAPLDLDRASQLGAGAPIARLGARSAVAGGDGRLVWFAVRGYSHVAVASRTRAARSDLEAGDLVLAERDVLGLGCEPLQSAELADDHWLRRGVRAGDVLCADGVERKPPVVRGADVAVIYAAGRVRLRAVARAEEDARMGATVAVRNPSNGDVYFAVVSGNNEVTVHD